jgi:shikimate kinase
MGVGKSVVGKALSRKTGRDFIDLDEEIVKNAGKEIQEIFREEGETAFRELEKRITREISTLDCAIIACGGGTVLDEENLANLKRNSKLVYLTSEAKTILERVEAEGEVRPLLNVKDRLGEIQKLLEARQPRYFAAADLIVDTTNSTPCAVVKKILFDMKGEEFLES